MNEVRPWGEHRDAPDTPALAISVEQVGVRSVVTLAGELDLASIDSFSSALREARAEGSERIEIDAKNLTFVDSAGLQALLSGRRLTVAAGGSFKLLHVSPALQRMLELSGLAEIFADPDAE